MGRELERKYRADEAAIAAIRQAFGGFTPIAMETAYFDTPGGALSRRRWTLRRRLENGRSVCTLKTPLPDGSRGEWEVEARDVAAAISELCRLGAPRELMTLTAQGVTEVCAARFTRLATTVTLEDCTLELALDQGVLLGGGKELPLCEVEAEWKSGREEALHTFAETLAQRFGLKPEPKSKAQRAMELAGR